MHEGEYVLDHVLVKTTGRIGRRGPPPDSTILKVFRGTLKRALPEIGGNEVLAYFVQ